MSEPQQPYGPPGRALRRTPFQFGLLAAAGAVLSLLGFAALRAVAGILVLLLFAGFLAVGLNRPVVALGRRGLRRPAAVAIVAGGAVLIAVAVVLLVVPTLVRQGSQFLHALPGYLSQLMHSPPLSSLESNTDLSAKMSRLLTPQHLAALAAGLLGGLFGAASVIAWSVTGAVLSVFILVAYERLRTGAYAMFPASRRVRVTALGDAILTNVGGYLVGAIAIAVVAGTAAGLWVWAVGLPYPVLLGLLIAGFDLIPQVGATIGATIVCLIGLTVSLQVALASVGFFLVYQAVENWLVYPRVMSRAVHISNLAAIVSVLLGGALFGVAGVLVAVPTYAAVQLIVREVVKPRQDAC